MCRGLRRFIPAPRSDSYADMTNTHQGWMADRVTEEHKSLELVAVGVIHIARQIRRELVMMTWKTLLFTAIAVPAIGIAAPAQQARQGPLKRTVLQMGDFPPGYQTVMVIAEMEPGACSGWHTHPGLESAYFLEGEVLMKFAGKADLVVKAGEPVLILPGLPHNDCNVSGKPFRALAHYIVEKSVFNGRRSMISAMI